MKGTLQLSQSAILTPFTKVIQRSRMMPTPCLLAAPLKLQVAPHRIRISMLWWCIQTASVLGIRCIQRSAHSHTQTRSASRLGHPKISLPSPPITCTTLRTALFTGGLPPASLLSEPSPLPIAPEHPLPVQQAPPSAPRFSPARTPCLPSLLPSTIQTSTLLYRPGRPPYPQNSTRLLCSHAWRVRSLSLHTSYTFSPCLTSRMSVCLSVCLYFCLSSLVWMWWPTRLCHLWPRGFADLKELGNCSCFIYQKVRPCRPSDTSYLLCPFKSAKGLQKGNSCFCHKVSRVTLITVSLSLSVFPHLSVSLSRCCSCRLFVFAWCTHTDTCISCKANLK